MNKLHYTGILLCIWLISLKTANCRPPEDPIKCASGDSDCTITNTYGLYPDRSKCHASKAAYPTTLSELISTVADGTKLQMKMKVATAHYHSIPKLACPGGKDGLVISTKNLNRILQFDLAAGTVTLESGVLLRKLINEAAKVGLALPYAPYWWGVTVGGMLSTGAHGSSLWGRGSAVHDHVLSMTVVSPGTREDGYVMVREIGETDPDLAAAKVSMGLLGVIYKVTIALEPMFKRSITYKEKSDVDLGDKVAEFGKQHEFADIMWHPSQQKAAYRIDDRVPVSTPGNGLYNFIGFRSTDSIALAANRVAEEGAEVKRDANGKCGLGKVITTALKALAYGLTNDEHLFNGYPVVGFQNRMQSSGTCLDSKNDSSHSGCPWDPRLKGEYFLQSAFSIGLSKVKGFIKDVQSLVKLEPSALCGLDLYNGIWIRYVTNSSAILGKEEDGVDFDMTYYRSKDPMEPRLHEDVLEEIEQMAIFKYNALPHWGKNRPIAFEGAAGKYKRYDEFLRVKNRYDPGKYFSNEWVDQVLGLKGGLTADTDGCALEGLCRCSEDRHCAPHNNYLCKPGRVYKEARVCRLLPNNIKVKVEL